MTMKVRVYVRIGVYLGPLQLHEKSQPSVDEDVGISLFKVFFQEQWVGFDVILVNDNNVSVVDGILRNFAPLECVDANPLGEGNVNVCILNSLLPVEILIT